MGRIDASWKKVKKVVIRMALFTSPSKRNLGKGPIEDFHLIEYGPKISKWVILEDGKFNIVWDSISNITYIISFMVIPLVICSNLELLDSLWIFELILDIILAIDIGCNFFTSYTTDVKHVTDLKKIFYHYLLGDFIFDFIGIIPGLVTAELVLRELYYLKLFRFKRVDKFFTQIKFILQKLDKFLTFLNKKTVENILIISKCLFAMLFLIHVMG